MPGRMSTRLVFAGRRGIEETTIVKLLLLATLLQGCGDALRNGDDVAMSEECAELFSDPGTHTPATLPPAIKSREQALRVIGSEYPEAERSAGVGGTALVWILVSETGSVARAELAATSGHASLDSAAVRSVLQFRFTPPYEGKQPTCHWMRAPVVFSPEK